MYRDELLKRRLTLERQIAAAKKELSLIDRILELNPTQKKANASTEEAGDQKVYAAMTASQAISHFLSTRRYQFTTAREIYRGLIEGGIATGARRFDNVVYNECDRMVDRDDLELGKKDGKKAYRLKGSDDE